MDFPTAIDQMVHDHQHALLAEADRHRLRGGVRRPRRTPRALLRGPLTRTTGLRRRPAEGRPVPIHLGGAC